MIWFVGTPQAQLVEAAAQASDPYTVMEGTLAALAPNLTTEQQALLRIASNNIIMRASTGGSFSGSRVLHDVLYGSWQEILGLPDTVATAVAIGPEMRCGIYTALLSVCAGIVTGHIAGLTALAAVDTSVPTGWDTPPDPVEPENQEE
jgi:hypothetical protein